MKKKKEMGKKGKKKRGRKGRGARGKVQVVLNRQADRKRDRRKGIVWTVNEGGT